MRTKLLRIITEWSQKHSLHPKKCYLLGGLPHKQPGWNVILDLSSFYKKIRLVDYNLGLPNQNRNEAEQLLQCFAGTNEPLPSNVRPLLGHELKEFDAFMNADIYIIAPNWLTLFDDIKYQFKSDCNIFIVSELIKGSNERYSGLYDSLKTNSGYDNVTLYSINPTDAAELSFYFSSIFNEVNLICAYKK
ncbi:MAG: hypothetical protein EHM45_12120 [Desulfobacteraceae bacterium]|nr:MAG: hypothetical protein EHM45_12120 [Desulfobacteraceae bacterium]